MRITGALPHCDHDDSAHDSELGCLFPGCGCKETHPQRYRVSMTLRAANEPRTRIARPRRTFRQDVRLFFALTGLGVPAGVLLTAGLLAALVIMLACVKFPKEVDPRFNSPSPTIDRPMQTGRQDPPK